MDVTAGGEEGHVKVERQEEEEKPISVEGDPVQVRIESSSESKCPKVTVAAANTAEDFVSTLIIKGEEAEQEVASAAVAADREAIDLSVVSSSMPLKKRKISPPSGKVAPVTKCPESLFEAESVTKLTSVPAAVVEEKNTVTESNGRKGVTSSKVTTTSAEAPGPPIPVTSSGGKGQSKGMGCGRPGYITCSICNATKYYSHVQRRFGQFSCEPCSKFMKRFLRDPKQYTCQEDGHCTIGCAPGEQEPRGVSVSRCKACWLQICLDKFILEASTREVIDQHYLPKLASGAGRSSAAASGVTASNSTPLKSSAAFTSVPTVAVTSLDGGPPLPLPQRKRKQKEDAVLNSNCSNSSAHQRSTSVTSRKQTTTSGQGAAGRRTRKSNTTTSVRYKQAGNGGGRKSKGAASAQRQTYLEEQDSYEDDLMSVVPPSPPASGLYEPIYSAKRSKAPTNRNRKRPVYQAPSSSTFDLTPDKMFDESEVTFEFTTTRPLTTQAMRSRSSSPFMGMGYTDHDYGYSKASSPSSADGGELGSVDCGSCYQCLNAKRHPFELDLDALASKPVVVLKESCCTKRISVGGKNGPTACYLSAMAHAANAPEPESPKAGTKADTLGLELTIPSLYSASDLMMGIEPASTEAVEVEVPLITSPVRPDGGLDTTTLNSLVARRSPPSSAAFYEHSNLDLSMSSRTISSSTKQQQQQRRKKMVTKPLKKVLLSSYRSFRSIRDESPSDDELLEPSDREARESLFFDEILNANSPFL